MATPLTLKEVRKGMLGWTQEQLACELGLTRRTIFQLPRAKVDSCQM